MQCDSGRSLTRVSVMKQSPPLVAVVPPGGRDVDFHMVAPGSRGLFSAAIAQSPACAKFLTLEQVPNPTSHPIKTCRLHIHVQHQYASWRKSECKKVFIDKKTPKKPKKSHPSFRIRSSRDNSSRILSEPKEAATG